MTERVKGKIKWFDKNRGYGFITSDGTDYFFHYSSIKNDERLEEGDDVEFKSELAEKGFRAVNVTKIKE